MGHYIDLDGTFNFRDIGGFAAGDKRVREGLLYRSDALHQLSDRDLIRLQEMGIRTVVDFRSPKEATEHPNRLPDGMHSLMLSPIAGVAAQASASKGDDSDRVAAMVRAAETEESKTRFRNNLDSMEKHMRTNVTSAEGIKAYGDFLRLLTGAGNIPLVFHCKGGKDRTGWAAALVLSILGADRKDIIEDYMDTAKYNKERNEARMNEYRRLTDNGIVLDFLSSLMQVKEAYLLAAFDEVDKLGGMEAYVVDSLGLTDEEIAILKCSLLEG
ncbi:MAG: tyrosine-protein phosphatase [Lachnospiraceae bacterium]